MHLCNPIGVEGIQVIVPVLVVASVLFAVLGTGYWLWRRAAEAI